MRNLLGGNATRIADGEPPLEPSTPKGGDDFSQPTILARIHQYLSMATPLMWTRQPDTIGVLGLALNACDSPTNGYRNETEQIRELLDDGAGPLGDGARRRTRRRSASAARASSRG